MKKKILVIGPGMEIGGVERSLLGLLESIDYEKYEVDLFLLAHTGEFMKLIDKRVNLLPEIEQYALCDWSILNLIKKKYFKIACIRLVSKIIGDIYGKWKASVTISYDLCRRIVTKSVDKFDDHYDMALGFYAPHHLLLTKVEADLKVGWVHTDYSNVNEMPDKKYTFPMWRSLDYIACVSDKVKTSFDLLYPTLSKRTIVVENILSADFVKKQADIYNVKEEMPDNGMYNILSVGRFCTAKAFDEVVVACSILIAKGYPIKWYLIGYGPDESLIRKKIHEYHMEAHVIILGKKDNPYPYIKGCDLYVQPSRYEGKAVTVREAQILGKPVMITRFATSASQLEENVDGYICEMGVDGIVAGIEYLLQNQDIMKKLALGTLNKKYDNTNEIDKIYQLMEK